MLDKAYDPKAVEDRIYAGWEDSGAFKPEACDPKGEPFTISMPPPNATGQLHLGHAVMLALEDIFIRFARMRGKKALWVPGTDHAAIATESVVIKKIQKEEKVANARNHYGREKLVARIAEFVTQSRQTIRSQIRKMGSSCDWSRERYTLDPALNRCVIEVFKKMHAQKLIYPAYRVVNWDTALQTTISDDEIEHKDQEAILYTILYLTSEQTGGEPVYVSTSRPETKLGDSALVVHPDDARYKYLIGKEFKVVWPKGPAFMIPVIADYSIDPDFGTGVLGLTPYHSKTDELLWQRHKEKIKIPPTSLINEEGKMTQNAGSYAEMTVEECRNAFVEELRLENRILKEEKYVQPLSVSYRSGKSIEPLPKLQWFIDVSLKVVQWKGKKMSLKEIMQDVVKKQDIRIIPEQFEKTYFQWINNLQDWCISRQIWWGHRVPVWICQDTKCNPLHVAIDSKDPINPVRLIIHPGYPENKGIYVGVPEKRRCPVCKKIESLKQDEDTLDTWFSSALWTWSTLIDPALAENPDLSLEDILKKSPDFQEFHPTTVMETGYDILFFWVARMILMTTYATGQIPFKTVYLHGLIRTRDGKKMSKSHPETMIDPLDIIPKYGADALRLSMIVGQSPGADSRLYEEKIAGYRNFINKLWNASRFVLLQCEQAAIDPTSIETLPDVSTLSLADRAILHASEILIEDVTKGLETYALSETGEKLYSFTWDTFCDWYLELSKGTANHAVLVHVLRRLLTLLHPYCPFITEELWSHVKPAKDGALISKSWPKAKSERKDPQAFRDFQTLIDVITAIRRLRAESQVEAGKKVNIFVHSKKHAKLLDSQKDHIVRMGYIEHLVIDDTSVKHPNSVSAFLKDIEVHVSLEGLFDPAKLKANLQKEQADLTRYAASIKGKLENKNFVDRAPKELVEAEQAKLHEAQEKLAKIGQRLQSL